MTAGQVSDYTGAAALLDDLSKAQRFLADRGYDADWLRDALHAKGIRPCIPGRRSRDEPVKYDKRRYRCRSRVDLVWPLQGLAARCHTLRSLPNGHFPPLLSLPPSSSSCNRRVPTRPTPRLACYAQLTVLHAPMVLPPHGRFESGARDALQRLPLVIAQ